MNDIVCSECGCVNESVATYCEECGAVLQPEGKTLPGVASLYMNPGDLLRERYEIISVVSKTLHDASYLAIDKKKRDSLVWVKQKEYGGRGDGSGSKYFEILSKIMKTPHENIAAPLDVFQDKEERFFVVFDALKGEDLGAKLEKLRRSLDSEELLNWAMQAAEGIRHLHSLGILHRDIQPGNLFITEDKILKITGFSRVSLKNDTITDNTVTEGYSPPEAFGLVGGVIDERSDIFSLGATLYSLVIGRAPKVSRENFFTFTSFAEKDRKVSRKFEEVILKAARKEPVERFDSMNEMLRALNELKKEGVKGGSDEVVTLEFEVAARSHVGKVRKVNQDSYLINRLGAFDKEKYSASNLLVVADGMGAEAEGDEASSLAIRVIGQEVINQFLQVVIGADTAKLYPTDLHKKSSEMLKQSVLWAHKVVYDYSREDISRRGMGCTISAALVMGNNLCICHAGDTRVYIYNENSGIKQLTEDHSLVGRLIRMGQMTREEALVSPYRSGVYRALGTTTDLEVDIYQYILSPGDYVLLCSDGVWEYFPDTELVSIICQEVLPGKIIDHLIKVCLEKGAEDNATAIVLRVLKEGKDDKSSAKSKDVGTKIMLDEKIEKVEKSGWDAKSSKRQREEMEKQQWINQARMRVEQVLQEKKEPPIPVASGEVAKVEPMPAAAKEEAPEKQEDTVEIVSVIDDKAVDFSDSEDSSDMDNSDDDTDEIDMKSPSDVENSVNNVANKKKRRKKGRK